MLLSKLQITMLHRLFAPAVICVITIPFKNRPHFHTPVMLKTSMVVLSVANVCTLYMMCVTLTVVLRVWTIKF